MQHATRPIKLVITLILLASGITHAALITGDFSGYVYNSFSNSISLGNGFADGRRITGTFQINTASAQVVDRDANATSAEYRDQGLDDNWIDIQWQLEGFEVEGALASTRFYDTFWLSQSTAKDYLRLHDYDLIPSSTGDTYISKSFFIEEYQDDLLRGVDIAQSFAWSDNAQGCGDQPNTFERCAFFNFTQRGGDLTYTFVNAWLDSVNFYGQRTPDHNLVPAPASAIILSIGCVFLAIRRHAKNK